MSLHLPFVALRAGQGLGEFLEAGDWPLFIWDDVVAAVLPLLPDAEVDAEELVDRESGFELTSDPLTVVVAYGLADDAAADLLLQVVTAVEAATGLTAYDPLTGEPALAGGAEGLDAAVARAAAPADDDGPGLTGLLLRAAARRAIGLG